MVTVKMHSKFIMAQEDINTLKALPDNFPETHLTKKQKDLVETIYYRYLRREIVSNDLLKDLYVLEQKEIWPHGERVKKHEAQRLVLQWLIDFNKHPELDIESAAVFFYTNIRTCEANRILVTSVYYVTV